MNKATAEIEVSGHLIDGNVLKKIFDQIIQLGGQYFVEEIHFGKLKEDPSYVCLTASAENESVLNQILAAVIKEGAKKMEIKEKVLGIQMAQDIEVGHLIRGQIISKLFDIIIQLGGEFLIKEINIGKNENDPSYAIITIIGKDSNHLDELLEACFREGAVVKKTSKVKIVNVSLNPTSINDLINGNAQIVNEFKKEIGHVLPEKSNLSSQLERFMNQVNNASMKEQLDLTNENKPLGRRPVSEGQLSDNEHKVIQNSDEALKLELEKLQSQYFDKFGMTFIILTKGKKYHFGNY